MQEILNELEDNNATLVALTPQLAEHNQALMDKHALNFHLLSTRKRIRGRTRASFEVTTDVKEIYSSFGIDLPKYNGDESWTLPVPARLVIDSDGIIRATDIDVDYTVGLSPGRQRTT